MHASTCVELATEHDRPDSASIRPLAARGYHTNDVGNSANHRLGCVAVDTCRLVVVDEICIA